jgi:hypothetical protein
MHNKAAPILSSSPLVCLELYVPSVASDDPQEKREYCKLKEEAPDCTMWRACCGIGCGLVTE